MTRIWQADQSGNLKPITQQRIGGFDGLRALAVLAVFFSHRASSWVGSLGSFGVTLFFALSGFLIIGILYEERLVIETKRKSVGAAWRAFLVRRSFRIFPIYYLTLAVLALLAFLHISRTDWNPVGHIFHVFYFSNVWIFFIQKAWIGQYSHLWSLSIEEQFYLLAAPLLLFSPARMHIAICITVVGVGFISQGAMLISGPSCWIDIFFACPSDISVDAHYFISFESIALGGVAVLAYKQDKCKLGGDALLALAIGSFAMTWAALLVALGRLSTTLVASIPIISALIVMLVSTSQTGFIVKILEWRPLAHLGRISYGFYLYHNFVWLKIFDNLDIWHRIGELTMNFAIVFILAELSWCLIEFLLYRLSENALTLRLSNRIIDLALVGELT